ncbi:MAG: hypothetical protein ACHQUC_06575 [Chlamydiales bacterium]
MNIQSVQNSLIVGCVIYAGTQALSYLPNESNSQQPSKIDQLRHIISTNVQEAKRSLGEKNWFIITNIILDNAWISAALLVYLSNEVPMFDTLKRTVETGAAFLGLCPMLYTVRFGTVKLFPSLSCIEPRNH